VGAGSLRTMRAAAYGTVRFPPVSCHSTSSGLGVEQTCTCKRAHQPKTGGAIAKKVTSMQEIRRHQVYRVRERHRPWLLARLRRLVRLTAARGPQKYLAAQTNVRGPQLAAPDPAGC
jgi:hypothetical protein